MRLLASSAQRRRAKVQATALLAILSRSGCADVHACAANAGAGALRCPGKGVLFGRRGGGQAGGRRVVGCRCLFAARRHPPRLQPRRAPARARGAPARRPACCHADVEMPASVGREQLHAVTQSSGFNLDCEEGWRAGLLSPPLHASMCVFRVWGWGDPTHTPWRTVPRLLSQTTSLDPQNSSF